ncbi:MAG: hypothetical protein WA397_19975 [Roseiarcus sp.]
MSSEEDLSLTQQRPEVVDSLNCQFTFTDWIVTAGCHENIVNITLGTIDHAVPGSNGLPRIAVASRLRFSRETGVRLYELLGNIIGVAQESPPSEPDPTPVPKNKLN